MESTSINQFIASALAEKIAALETESYLEERAKRASKRKFHKVLDKIPDVEAESFDTWKQSLFCPKSKNGVDMHI